MKKLAHAIFAFAVIAGAVQVFSGEADAQTRRATTKRVAKKQTRREREGEAVTIVRHGRKIVLSEDKDLARTDKPAEAVKAELDARLPKGAKVLPLERYFTAKEKIKGMKRFSSASNQLVPSRGDAPSLSDKASAADSTASVSGGASGGVLGTWQPLGPGNVGGRTRAILIDPNNPNVMYIAGVAGGVWKSTNAGASWSPLEDFMANVAVTSLAFEPGNTSVIYAGTGEGVFNGDSVRGAGIFKSTDAGASWTRLANTNNSNFYYVNDVVVGNGANAQHVYAATRTGVWRSLDGGANWTQVIVSNAANGANGAMDLAIRTDQTTDYIFASVGTLAQAHIWRNTDAGGAGAWVDVYTEANMGRTSLAIAPSNQNTVYAMSLCLSCTAGSNPNFADAVYTDGLLAVFRSVSNGDAGSWTTQTRSTTSANKQDTLLLSNPVNGVLTQCGFGTSQYLNQGWYDNVIAVDPTDENKVWAGGIDIWRSDNGGVNWGVASYWWFQGNGTPPNNGDPQLVHADNHAIVFHPGYNGTSNQTMYVGDDGGIYKTDNAKAGNVGYVNGTTPSGGTVTSTSPICGQEYTPGGFYTVPNPVIWGPLNNGYAVTQFWPGAVYPDGKTYFAGSQDNGTNRGTDVNGPNQWERINGGDGGYAAVDFNNTNILYSENTGNSFQKSTNGGSTFAAARTGISGDTFPFTSVFRMDPNNSARLWYAGQFMWRTDNSATSWTRTSDVRQTGGSVTAMAIAPGNSDKVVNGAASGQIRRTTAGTTLTSTSALNTVWTQSFTPRGNGFGGISWLEYDPSNTNTLWATVSNFNSASSGNGFGHVFKSTDSGATWTLADGNQIASNPNAIPDIPVWAVAVDPSNSSRIYVGTDLGVFVTLDGGANWAQETTGFSNTVVKSLEIKNIGGANTIYAFTHGRGAFKVTIPASCATVTAGTTNFGANATNGSISVTKNGGVSAQCTWNAVSQAAWITINSVTNPAPLSGSDNGSVNFSLAANTTGASRSGVIVVAGTPVTITQAAAPTAATVSVAGRVIGSDGGGVRGAVVTMTSPTGVVRTALTNAFGYYSFDSVQSGTNYLMRATAKRYTFSPRTIAVSDSLTDVDFVDGQ